MSLPNFYRGDTYPIRLQFSDPSTGQAIDITGWVFTVTIKTNATDPDNTALIQIQVVASGSEAIAGEVTVTLSSTDTDIAVGTYVMDIQRAITGTPPDILTVIKQNITVLQDVTLTP